MYDSYKVILYFPGEKIGVEYLLAQTDKVLQDLISSTDTDNADLARQEEAATATEEGEEDEGFEDDIEEDDPTQPPIEPAELSLPMTTAQQPSGQPPSIEVSRQQSSVPPTLAPHITLTSTGTTDRRGNQPSGSEEPLEPQPDDDNSVSIALLWQ